MGQSISGLKQADTGVTNLTKMVDQAKAIAGQARDALAKGTSEAKVTGNANLKNIADLTTVSGINTTSRLDFAVTTRMAPGVTLIPERSDQYQRQRFRRPAGHQDQ